MKLDGAFLRSKVGRRMFFGLLAAAAVPIAFFGISSYRALNDYAATQVQNQLNAATKYAALDTLNRLILARTMLGVMADRGAPDATSGEVQGGGRALAELAVLSRSGEWLSGSRRLAQLWRSGQVAGEAAPPGLWWPRTDAAASARAPVVVTRVAANGRLWLGEVDGNYLFDALSADMVGGTVCIFDQQGHALSCPGAALDEARRRLRDGSGFDRGESAQWNLFLRSEFGVEDWILVNLAETHHAADASQSVAKSALQVALATLLIVTLLSLVQIRRTTVPLERLISGTRRLIGRDFSARVAIDRDDEFGELADAFNQMAAQIGRQIDALQVRSTIDAEILDRLDVAQVMQRVLQRLEAVIPDAQVGIVEIDAANGDASILHRRGSISHVPGIGAPSASSDADSDGWHTWRGSDRRPPWLHWLALANAAQVQTLNVMAHGSLLAWITIAWPAPTQLDDETLREVRELGDRVGVTLTAAQHERQLVEGATTDNLTALLNRTGLADAVGDRIQARAGSELEPLNLLFIDLDRFKDVNDHLGHQAGDELLCVIARRLADCAPPGSLLARPGGDEFVLAIPGASEHATAVAAQICTSLAAPVPLRGQIVSVGASIGIARHPEHGLTLIDLLRRADMAMYQAKAGGRGRYQWFEPALDARQSDRMALLQDLQQALVRGQFELQYQPRVSALTLQICSVEALLRWRHPTRGLVAPNLFIDLLEETGQIESVGQWVLATACRQLKRWRAGGVVLDRVAVNVSPRQIQAARYAEQVLETVAAAQLAASDVEVEVTEGLFVSHSQPANDRLQRLRDAGMRVAIDDFGTGYSSLSYLHRLPFDVLKIDRSFVSELGVTADAEGVTHAIVALARALKKHIVAEGVETQQQARHLRDLGCDEFQGYFYSRPLDPVALATWVAAQHAERALECESAA